MTQYLVILSWDGRFGSDGPEFSASRKSVRARSPLDAIRRAAAAADGDFIFLHDPMTALEGKRLRTGISYLVSPHRALWVEVIRPIAQ